ncbi:unnamed protein product [Medioppia subpectinata]|uniref:Methyltransferase domain-containing protein n=1 Tax=Medioppia subpectinata TaxID=1979941 RepID=A0A7R9KDV6_9ACAR|nr:unnamed protein product [Medioppia subpectinata]CAG2101349.1 unnamed protein product [Medioppia subpectinata]
MVTFPFMVLFIFHYIIRYFDVILDIGSGSGNVTDVLADSVKHRQIIGLDIDPKMIDFSIQNNTKPSIDYQLEDISKPWDELSADIRALEGKVSLVFSNSTLMMIQNKSTFVHNLRRLMADNSYAFTSFVLIHNFTTKLSPEERSECEKWIKIPDYDKQVSIWTDVFTTQGFTIELTEIKDNYIINDTSLVKLVELPERRTRPYDHFAGVERRGKAVIIYGKNGFFCSGIDLNFARNECSSRETGVRLSRLMVANTTRLQSLPMVTVAAVEGQALAGGSEITTACDWRVMSRSAQIGFIHIHVGVSTGWGGGTRLTHLLGPIKALDLLLSGRKLNAEEALAIGLANRLFDDMVNTDMFIDAIAQWLNTCITTCDKSFIKLCKESCYSRPTL